MSKLKKTAAMLAVIATFFTLCACGAEVNYYYESDGYDATYKYDVRISKSILDELDGKAAYVSGSDNLRWTVALYLRLLGESFGFDVTAAFEGDERIFSFSRTVPLSSIVSDSDEDDVRYEVRKGFFRYKVTYTQGSPFNGLRAQYDGTETAETGTVMDVLLHGSGLLPSFGSAFPAAAGYSPDGLKLNFYWSADGLSDVNNDKSEYRDGKQWMIWEARFDSENREIVYSYNVVNPVGWYVVILGAGILVTVIILLATVKSKAKPKFVKAERGPVRYGRPSGNAGNGASVKYDLSNFDIYASDEDVERRRLQARIDEVFGESDAERAKRELEALFDGVSPEDREKERLKKRIEETLPPEEAEKAKKKLDNDDAKKH